MEERTWSEGEVELLLAVGNQLAIALDQAELYKEAASTSAKIATNPVGIATNPSSTNSKRKNLQLGAASSRSCS
ncbi:hypothetical protein MiSe_05280 [Microseira wollei NIES-4236]|uniref:Uncharacterized protein n=1 Tax=Microseira wollei NIES-4236 TaxID=2530354 RepID=A0AAV3X6E6_9CYAN|nr:hypothetical protein MiSe_05280 [Microseira wollei NIES-4236]